MVEKKSQKSQEEVWVLGSNTVADQRLTPNLQRESYSSSTVTRQKALPKSHSS